MSQRFFRSSVVFKSARGSETKKLRACSAVDTHMLTTEGKARGAGRAGLRKAATTEPKHFVLPQNMRQYCISVSTLSQLHALQQIAGVTLTILCQMHLLKFRNARVIAIALCNLTIVLQPTFFSPSVTELEYLTIVKYSHR